MFLRMILVSFIFGPTNQCRGFRNLTFLLVCEQPNRGGNFKFMCHMIFLVSCKDFNVLVLLSGDHPNSQCTMTSVNSIARSAQPKFLQYTVRINRVKTYTVELGNKELFDKELIGIKEPFPLTKCQFTL